jgi:hypothetical protein
MRSADALATLEIGSTLRQLLGFGHRAFGQRLLGKRPFWPWQGGENALTYNLTIMESSAE